MPAHTCKAICILILPYLYRKLYTRGKTPQDTSGLVNLLKQRPEIVKHIKILVLDVYHPRYTWDVLSIGMPKLWSLLIQHEGGSPTAITDAEKGCLNKRLIDQPKLHNCTYPPKSER